MRRSCLYCAAAALVALAASAAPVLGAPAVIPLTLPSGKVLQVEVMVNDEDRQMGLMYRPSLPTDRGMLFVFEEADFHGIWMKNCRFPIDILWVDADHRVVHLAEAVPPCTAEPCPVYSPMRRASFVVELNAGQARHEKAIVGAALSFSFRSPLR
jgi:uncharacterized membrane protein (UPF0127 family)